MPNQHNTIAFRVFIAALRVYLQNFRLLITLFLPYFVFLVIESIYKPAFLGGLINCFFIILNFFLITFEMITLVSTVNNIIHGQKIVWRRFINDIRGKILKVLGVNLIYRLTLIALFIPMVLNIQSALLTGYISFDVGMWPSYFLEISLVSFMICWGVIYSLAPISAVLEKKETKSFAYGSGLVRGKFWSVFLGIGIILIITYFPEKFGGIVWAKDWISKNPFITDLLRAVYQLIALPFLYTYLTLLYVDLKNARFEECKSSEVQENCSDE